MKFFKNLYEKLAPGGQEVDEEKAREKKIKELLHKAAEETKNSGDTTCVAAANEFDAAVAAMHKHHSLGQEAELADRYNAAIDNLIKTIKSSPAAPQSAKDLIAQAYEAKKEALIAAFEVIKAGNPSEQHLAEAQAHLEAELKKLEG